MSENKIPVLAEGSFHAKETTEEYWRENRSRCAAVGIDKDTIKDILGNFNLTDSFSKAAQAGRELAKAFKKFSSKPNVNNGPLDRLCISMWSRRTQAEESQVASEQNA